MLLGGCQRNGHPADSGFQAYDERQGAESTIDEIAFPKPKSAKLLHAPAPPPVSLVGVVQQKSRPDAPALKAQGGHAGTPAGMDPEEAKIYLQSLPAEEVTRDFMQELLDEYLANQKRGPP
jgi:hypothetical protein